MPRTSSMAHLPLRSQQAYVARMAIVTIPADKITEEAGAVERGHAAWQRAKIERGLAESKDRAAMIPVEQVWRDLKLEG